MPISDGIGRRKTGNNNSGGKTGVNESQDQKRIKPVYGPTESPTPPPGNKDKGNKTQNE